MALKVKSSIEDLCVTEKVGGGGWICSRSGWLLELLAELIILSQNNPLLALARASTSCPRLNKTCEDSGRRPCYFLSCLC